jgi:hypothetical protein
MKKSRACTYFYKNILIFILFSTYHNQFDACFYPKLSEMEVHLCSFCEETNATRACVDCPDGGAPMCEGCYTATHSKGKYKAHNVVSITDYKTKQKCPKHTEFDLDFFCEACQEITCLSCESTDSHAGHKFCSLQTAVLEIKGKMQLCCSELQRHSEKLGEDKSKLQNRISVFQASIEEIKHKLMNSLCNVERFQEGVMKECDDQLKCLIKDQITLCEDITRAEHVVHSASCLGIFEAYHEIQLSKSRSVEQHLKYRTMLQTTVLYAEGDRCWNRSIEAIRESFDTAVYSIKRVEFPEDLAYSDEEPSGTIICSPLPGRSDGKGVFAFFCSYEEHMHTKVTVNSIQFFDTATLERCRESFILSRIEMESDKKIVIPCDGFAMQIEEDSLDASDTAEFRHIYSLYVVENKTLKSYTKTGTSSIAFDFNGPLTLAAMDDKLFFGHPSLNCVQALNAVTGEVLFTCEHPLKQENVCYHSKRLHAKGMCVLKNSVKSAFLFVVVTEGHEKVFVFDALTGEFKFNVPKYECLLGEHIIPDWNLEKPCDVAVQPPNKKYPDGALYVADRGLQCVKVFCPSTGGYYGILAGSSGKDITGISVCADSDGNNRVFVMNAAIKKIEVYVDGNCGLEGEVDDLSGETKTAGLLTSRFVCVGDY